MIEVECKNKFYLNRAINENRYAVLRVSIDYDYLLNCLKLAISLLNLVDILKTVNLKFNALRINQQTADIFKRFVRKIDSALKRLLRFTT